MQLRPTEPSRPIEHASASRPSAAGARSAGPLLLRRPPQRAVAAASPEAPSMGRPIDSSGDPRWVLAVRTAESLQGAILRPERRDRLVRLGKMLGLSAFDANLVIAIVQDQARRGYAPEYCPTAGETQLRLIPLPGARDLIGRRLRHRRVLQAAGWIASLLALELVVVWWFVG